MTIHARWNFRIVRALAVAIGLLLLVSDSHALEPEKDDSPKAYPAIPEAVTSFGAAILDGNLYIYGGHNGEAHSYSTESQAHTLWRLNLADPQGWKSLGEGPRLQGLAMVAHDGRLYRLGGFTARNEPGEEHDLWSQDGAAQYDPRAGKWSDLPPLPEPRSSFDAAVLNGKIYVMGGWQMAGDSEEVWHRTAYSLDLSDVKSGWQALPEPPFQRRALAVAAHAGKLYAIGGMQPKGGPTTRVDIFDPETQTWSRGPDLLGEPMEGFGSSAFASGGTLFVSTYAGRLQRLAPNGKAWLIDQSLERARFFHRMLPLPGDTLLSVGGASMQEGKFEEVDRIVPTLADELAMPPAPATEQKKDDSQAWRSFQNGGRPILEKSLLEKSLPEKWSPDENIVWQKELAGYGQSSPVVEHNHVYVTSTSGDMKENLHVECFDRTSGERLWQYAAKNSSPAKNTNYISRAAPTPVCDTDGVIAAFEGGNVIALTAEGKLRWHRDLVADYGEIEARHGLAASLEQDQNLAFVWIERQQDPYLLALDKKTSETVWKSPGLGATSWSSPRLVPTADGPHLVCSASGKLAGFNPATGDKLWEFTDISNNTSCTPIPLGDGQFLIGASDGRGEPGGSSADSNGLVQIKKGEDGTYGAEFVWRAKKASSSFGSPIVADRSAFILNRAGVLFELDLATGEEKSTNRVDSGSVWATPLVAGEHLYLFGYKGTSSVWSLSDNKQTQVNTLWEAGGAASGGFGSGPVLYAAVASPPYLILRSGNRLYCVGE